MRKILPALVVLFSIDIPLNLQAGRFEWQLVAGTWTLEPFTLTPVTTAATKLIQEEADHMIAPYLSEVNDLLAPFKFTFYFPRPEIKFDSCGYFFTAAAWYNLAAEKFAMGVSASYLNFTLPFELTAEQDFYLFNTPVAHISLRGDSHVNLRTIMTSEI